LARVVLILAIFLHDTVNAVIIVDKYSHSNIQCKKLELPGFTEVLNRPNVHGMELLSTST